MPGPENCDAYVHAATRAMLTGQPFETLVDACRRQAAEEHSTKVVDLADRRRKLRPPAPLMLPDA